MTQWEQFDEIRERLGVGVAFTWLVLLGFAGGRGGICFANMETIQKRRGVKERALRGHVAALKHAGYIFTFFVPGDTHSFIRFDRAWRASEREWARTRPSHRAQRMGTYRENGGTWGITVPHLGHSSAPQGAEIKGGSRRKRGV